AATTRAAFSNAARVQMSRGRQLRASSSITWRPAATAISSRDLYGAAAMLLLGRDNPIASPTQAMVLAVYCPPHAPWPGQAAFSIAVSSLSRHAPELQRPTTSHTSC